MKPGRLIVVGKLGRNSTGKRSGPSAAQIPDNANCVVEMDRDRMYGAADRSAAAILSAHSVIPAYRRRFCDRIPRRIRIRKT
jgi:hypothetical protein